MTSSVTPGSWAKSLLSGLGLPQSGANISAVTGWEAREGGNWNNTAHFNPLNTTWNEPGATSINSVGVKAYTSWGQGLTATEATLKSGLYNDILAALKQGNGLPGSYHGLSVWSGGGYSSITPGSSNSGGGGVTGSTGGGTGTGTTGSGGCPSFLSNPISWAACQAATGAASSNPIISFFMNPVDALERIGLVLFGMMLVMIGIAILGFGPAARTLGMVGGVSRDARAAGRILGTSGGSGSRATGPTPEVQAERSRRLQLAERNVSLGERKQGFKEQRERRLAGAQRHKTRREPNPSPQHN